jgi:hypothetical protein
MTKMGCFSDERNGMLFSHDKMGIFLLRPEPIREAYAKASVNVPAALACEMA